jgi:hypothetical protein
MVNCEFFTPRMLSPAPLPQFIRDNISQDVDVIMTDDFGAYGPAMTKATVDSDRHKTVNSSP